MIVCFPYSLIDQDLALTLAGWIRELGQNKDHTCLIIRDKRCNPGKDEQIRKELEQTFVQIETITAPAEIDGWPQGPNHLFQTAARHIQFDQQSPWIWLEADCVVLNPDWIDRLMNEYNEKRKPFLGDFVHVPNVPDHMSGIAVYPGIVVNYAGNTLITQAVAWDVAGADQILPNMATTKLIQHKWKHPPLENQSQVDNLLGQLGEDCVLFHADKSGSLIRLLRERRAAAALPLPIKQNDSSAAIDAGKATCDIFIKSYKKDEEWLTYCLRSIERFCSGFTGIEIVVPSNDCFQSSFDLEKCHWHIRPEYGNDGYLSQQVFKLNADTFTNADYILFIDSDTMFTRPVTPKTYFKDGKIVWIITPYSETQTPWEPITEKFLKMPVEYETMRRHPIVVPRWLLAEVQEFCQRAHNMSIADYVMSQPAKEFSEFNVLGAHAYQFHRDKFHWVDTSKVPENEWPELTVNQEWSHNPIDEDRRAKLENILSGAANQRSGKDGTTLQSPAPAPLSYSVKSQTFGSDELQAQLAAKKPLPEPWKDKEQSKLEIKRCATVMKMFCTAPIYTKYVRDQLREAGVAKVIK